MNKDLLNRLKNGEMAAFDAIYRQYCKRLFAFVVRYVKTKEDAEDVIQEVFIKIWKNREQIKEESSFDSFLFTTTYNLTISLLRKKFNEEKYLENFRATQETEQAPEFINNLYFRNLENKMNRLLDLLTPRQKEVFLLSRRSRLTHEEIAGKLNISVNTVKNHMVNALAFLKKNLKDDIAGLLFFYLFF